MKRKRLSNTEDEMMNLLWQEGRPLTSIELAELAGDGRWSSSYIQKMLAGLQKNGYVEVCGVQRDKNHYLRQFRACMTKEEYVAEMVEREGLDAAAIARVAVALVRKKRAPGQRHPELLDQLEKMLEDYGQEDGEA